MTFCKKHPPCAARCGACRAEIFRIRRAYDGITDVEFSAWMDHCKATLTPARRADCRPWVEQSLRRRNAPPERDLSKLTVRMTADDLEAFKADAARMGLSLQKFAMIALSIADPADVARTWRNLVEMCSTERTAL